MNEVINNLEKRKAKVKIKSQHSEHIKNSTDARLSHGPSNFLEFCRIISMSIKNTFKITLHIL